MSLGAVCPRLEHLYGQSEDPTADSSDPEKMVHHVFNRVLEIILQGALAKKLINSIPSPHYIMETAHILPAKPDAINPLIVRFYTQNIRNMLFR
jgi:hypothetical protein